MLLYANFGNWDGLEIEVQPTYWRSRQEVGHPLLATTRVAKIWPRTSPQPTGATHGRNPRQPRMSENISQT